MLCDASMRAIAADARTMVEAARLSGLDDEAIRLAVPQAAGRAAGNAFDDPWLQEAFVLEYGRAAERALARPSGR